jgi:cytochrome c
MAQGQDLVGHGGPVRALAVDDTRIYSGSFDTRAIVWQEAAALQVTRAHAGPVTAVLPLPDGRFASGGQDGHVAIWGAGNTPELFEPWHAMPIAGFAAWAGGLASASWDGRIALWDGAGAPRYLDAHDGQITGIVAYAGGLASVGADLRLRVWDAAGAPVSVRDLPAPPADLATDGTVFFVAGSDGFVRRIDGAGTDITAELTTRPLISIAADGQQVIASDMTGQVWVLDPDTLETRVAFASGQGVVWEIALADGQMLTGGNDGWIRRWRFDGTPLGEGARSLDATLTAPRGAEVFRACAVCHALTPEDQPRAGPTLHGVFGRRIGTVAGYDYSAALREMDIVWTPETVMALFEFGPTAYTPGSRMPEQTIPSQADRQALVDFLSAVAQ